MASLTMYDPATGKPVVVDSAQAGALFREGRATFAADQDVPVMGTDGKVRVIKGADAGAFFSSAEGLATGAASGQQLREQQLQDEFGGVGGQLGAAVAGAARGASAGLSDVALTELGLSARAYDKIRRVARTIADLSGSDKVSAEHIAEASALLQKAGAPNAVLVDCSHGNSGKQPDRQVQVAADLAAQITPVNDDLAAGDLVRLSALPGE